MLSGESGYWLVHLIEKQAETMQRLGYDEKDITEFRAKHRHLKHFRLEEIKEAIAGILYSALSSSFNNMPITT